MTAKAKINTGIETREVSDLTPGLSSVQMADGEIPVIDLGPMWSEDEVGKALLAEQVSTACQEIGFFYVKNHGVPDSVIADAQRVSGEFFKQSEKTKHATYGKHKQNDKQLSMKNTFHGGICEAAYRSIPVQGSCEEQCYT